MNQTPVTPHLLLISDNEQDKAFFADVAGQIGFLFAQANQRAALQTHLVKHPKSVIVWAVDSIKPEVSVGIRQVLATMSKPGKVFAVSEKSLNNYPELFKLPPFFQHHLYRRYVGQCREVYGALLKRGFEVSPKELLASLVPQAERVLYEMKAAEDRAVLVEKTEALFRSKNIPTRLGDRALQAIDELLMNAVFNAPVNDHGDPARRTWPRGKHFPLNAGEKITLELLIGAETLGVCVSDGFGSMKKDIFVRVVSQDFKHQNYKVKTTEIGAGLGLHNIVQTGLSLILVCEPKVRTESIVVFPIEASQKVLREKFHAVSYFGVTPPEVMTGSVPPNWATNVY